MSDIAYTIDVDTVNQTVTFTNNGTDLASIATLQLYMRGESKDTYEVSKALNKTAFNTTGDVFTYLELFGVATPPDNFYLCEVIGNESTEDPVASNEIALGFTYEIAEQVHYSTIGVHVPVTDLYTSLTLGAMSQVLEYLLVLSTNAPYTEDRENKWRKLFNHLTITVNDLDY